MRRSIPRAAILAVVLAVVGGCDGPGVASPDRPLLPIGGGAPTLSNAILGGWTRQIIFVDDFGITRSSETFWEFAGDGTAQRTVTTVDLTTGATDVAVTTSRWRVEDTTLVIDFISPTTGTLRFDVRVQGDELILAGESYLRSTA
jgi:hypothetical protein